MKTIKKLEQANDFETLKKANINRAFYRAYKSAVAINNGTLDFNEAIWERDVEPIIHNCKEFGIEYISISSTYSGLLDILAEFENKNCQLAKLITVNSPYKLNNSDDYEKINAMLIKIG